MTLLSDLLPIRDSRFLYALQGADLVSDDERKEVISLGTKAEQFDRLIEVMRVKGEPLDSFGRFLGVLQSDRNLKYLAKELQETRSREQSESDDEHPSDLISDLRLS
ncbi:uncharacterized protein LOC134193347 [Corticium candelabrum]|uniref:uncharacterized protein LOC134193347 n=1 Tax=Corticium candelabrum TaxID=121492 RepID=UPI002E256847|nr:uncharacterized protein LOC134193347 [Corticium candelabrum]